MNRDTLYKEIGGFLAKHHLWPGPENYALVYQLFAEPASPTAAAIRAATNDGVRLTQRDANAIMESHEMAPAPAQNSHEAAALMVATRQQVEELAVIVEASQAHARDYGRDLAEGAAKLESAGDTAPVSTLIDLTRAMLERTTVAERQLSAARKEAQTLRERLAEVEQEARSDPLTSLPNRRALEERLAEVQKQGSGSSLAICDIDDFKRINDRYGHGVGDRVLRTIAGLLQSSCNGHMVARFGGEEFVVLFEGVEPPQAAEILDEARELLAAKHFKLRESDAPLGKITFSAGVARCARRSKAPLARADALLYEAKNGGRNQVRFEAH